MNAAQTGDGLSILVVDDETMIVMLLEDMLLDLGCTVAGSAGSVAQSLALIERAKGCEPKLSVHAMRLPVV
jgi:CheY-like chemotaxis protein